MLPASLDSTAAIKIDFRLYRYFSWHAGRTGVKPHKLPYVPDTKIPAVAGEWKSTLSIGCSHIFCSDQVRFVLRHNSEGCADTEDTFSRCHNDGSRPASPLGDGERRQMCWSRSHSDSVAELVIEPRSPDSHSPPLTIRRHSIPKSWMRALQGKPTCCGSWGWAESRWQFSPQAKNDVVSQIGVREQSAVGDAIHWAIYQNPVEAASWQLKIPWPCFLQE